MNSVVVDASVAVKWLVPEVDTQAALLLLDGLRLLAPDLIIVECANILWKKVTRDNITASQASLAVETLRLAALDLRPMAGLMDSAVDLAIRLDHPAYDCFYLALAMAEGCPFVTADARFTRKAASNGLNAVVLSLGDPAWLAG